MKKFVYLLVLLLFVSSCSQTKKPDYTETPIPPTQKVIPSKTESNPTQDSPIKTTSIAASDTPTSTPVAESTEHPYMFEDINFFSPNEGWGVVSLMNKEVLMFSDTGGELWEILFPEPNQLPLLPEKYTLIPQFISLNEVWVAIKNLAPGEETDIINIWHTIDAGLTWDEITPLTPESNFDNFDISSLDFTSDGTGWVLINTAYGMGQDHIAVFTTYDSGISWEKLFDSIEDNNMQSCPKHSLDFYDDLYGWIIRDCFGILETTIIDITNDGGATWSQTFLPTPGEYPDLFTSYVCEYNSTFFSVLGDGFIGITCTSVDDPLIVVHVLYQKLFESPDWTYTFYPGGLLTKQQNELLWCVNDGVYWSEFDGVRWYNESSLPKTGKISFANKDYGWVLQTGSLGSVLLITEDGGIHWEEVDLQVINEGIYW